MGKMLLNRSNGCWLDVYDAERFTGNTRRLHGPADFPGLRIREKDWQDHLASISVGPGAYVQCYASANFDETVFWLLPNQVIEVMEELSLASASTRCASTTARPLPTSPATPPTCSGPRAIWRR